MKRDPRPPDEEPLAGESQASPASTRPPRWRPLPRTGPVKSSDKSTLEVAPARRRRPRQAPREKQPATAKGPRRIEPISSTPRSEGRPAARNRSRSSVGGQWGRRPSTRNPSHEPTPSPGIAPGASFMGRPLPAARRKAEDRGGGHRRDPHRPDHHDEIGHLSALISPGYDFTPSKLMATTPHRRSPQPSCPCRSRTA